MRAGTGEPFSAENLTSFIVCRSVVISGRDFSAFPALRGFQLFFKYVRVPPPPREGLTRSLRSKWVKWNVSLPQKPHSLVFRSEITIGYIEASECADWTTREKRFNAPSKSNSLRELEITTPACLPVRERPLWNCKQSGGRKRCFPLGWMGSSMHSERSNGSSLSR